MSIEILFRGKRKDNGEWETGFLIGRYDPMQKENTIKTAYIDNGTCFYSPVEVIPETVGQYTGLTDKSGKKIFEGDIVKTETDLWHGEDKKERVTRIGKVIYDEKFCQFGLNIKGFSKCFILKRWKGDFNEVIGNIHDNPELLEGVVQE